MHSDIKPDENVQFFRTGAYLDPKKDAWIVPIHAWVYELDSTFLRTAAFTRVMASRYNLRVTSDTEENFNRRLNLLIADNERGKRLVIRLAGRTYELPPTAPTGQVRTELEIPAAELPDWQPNEIVTYELVTGPKESRHFTGEVLLAPNDGVHLISDIDDTVKVTGVTNRRLLLDKTFYQPFESVEGMAQIYRDLFDQGIPLHFLSSSPWQLYAPLSEFMSLHGFPPAIYNLKTVRFRDKNLLNLFKKGHETKPGQLNQIFVDSPDCRFLLIGDNGEYDPEVYAQAAEHQPERIAAGAIRNINAEPASAARFARLQELLGPGRFLLFEQDEQLRAWLERLALLPAVSPAK